MGRVQNSQHLLCGGGISCSLAAVISHAHWWRRWRQVRRCPPGLRLRVHAKVVHLLPPCSHFGFLNAWAIPLGILQKRNKVQIYQYNMILCKFQRGKVTKSQLLYRVFDGGQNISHLFATVRLFFSLFWTVSERPIGDISERSLRPTKTEFDSNFRPLRTYFFRLKCWYQKRSTGFEKLRFLLSPHHTHTKMHSNT